MLLLNKNCLFVLANVVFVSSFNIFLKGDNINDNEDVTKPILRKAIHYTHPLTPKEEKCYEDHVRCLLNIHISSKPVCAYKSDQKDGGGGFKAFRTICDAYLTNCFADYKYWRIFSSPECIYLAPKRPKHWWGKFKNGYRILDSK